MPIRLALIDSAGVYSLANADSRFGLTGGGGNLLELYGEGKFNIFEHLGAALWLKASWLQCRGNGTEDFEDTFFGYSWCTFLWCDLRISRRNLDVYEVPVGSRDNRETSILVLVRKALRFFSG